MRSDSGKGKLRKPRVKHEILELEDKLTGKMTEFRLYQDKDLPFLNADNEMSNMMRENIIDGDVDDDCQTDDEQKSDAKDMMKNEIKNAITKFLQDKKDGLGDQFVKNLNIQKRYARPPF